MDGAEVFGIAVSGESGPEVAWLEQPVPLTPELLAKTGDVDPQRIFRMSAPCAASDCLHFDGVQCQLATRIVQILPAVTEALPPCQLRASCRWYVQEGAAACYRCPQVITHYYEPSERLVQAASPPR
jgi:hypothetical protein